MRRVLLAVAAFALLLVLVPAAPAQAGGANLHPVQDRYEPGDIATFVAYVIPSAIGGWVSDAPYATFAVSPAGERFRLGTIAFEPAPRLGPRALRVTLTATVPDHLAAGHYSLLTCNDGCVKGLGDLAGGTLNVGVDPVQPFAREWPPDEPEIVNLPEGAVVYMPAVSEPPAPAAPAEAAAPAAPAVAPAAPLPGLGAGPAASPVALLLGGALAAACVGLVLVALRQPLGPGRLPGLQQVARRPGGAEVAASPSVEPRPAAGVEQLVAAGAADPPVVPIVAGKRSSPRFR